MKRIVLLRHGESVWNRENRFTGWTDVDLSEKGVAEAVKAGETLRREGFHFGRAYASYLKRAVKTPRRRARQDGPGLDSGDEDMAAQREALRHAPGAEQARDGREIRRRAGARLAPQLRCGPRAPGRGRPTQSAPRSPLRRDSRRLAAPHRVVERHRGPHDALLGVRNPPRRWPVTTNCWWWPTANACGASSRT